MPASLSSVGQTFLSAYQPGQAGMPAPPKTRSCSSTPTPISSTTASARTCPRCWSGPRASLSASSVWASIANRPSNPSRSPAQFPIVVAAVGIQPNSAAEAKPGDWDEVVRLAETEPRVVAIGETGLDRYWDRAPFPLQEDYFARHIELARRLNKPFAIHCREAEADVVRMLRAEFDRHGPIRAVMHSFTGDLATARACLEMGLFISFAGMVTYPERERPARRGEGGAARTPPRRNRLPLPRAATGAGPAQRTGICLPHRCCARGSEGRLARRDHDAHHAKRPRSSSGCERNPFLPQLTLTFPSTLVHSVRAGMRVGPRQRTGEQNGD